MKIVMVPASEIRPYENNPRHNDEAVGPVIESLRISKMLVQPCVLDRDKVLVVGHTRFRALVEMGETEIPCVFADDLTDEQVRRYRIADNALRAMSGWDREMLMAEMDSIGDQIDMSAFQIDAILPGLSDPFEGMGDHEGDEIPGGSGSGDEIPGDDGDGEDEDDDVAIEDAWIVLGRFKRQIPRAAYERWLASMHREVGYVVSDIAKEVRRRIGR